jgi:initiation factor 1A
MPKFNGSGKLKKKAKNVNARVDSRPLETKESDFEIYGYVTKELGDCRFTVEFEDKTQRVCKLMKAIKGSMKVLPGCLVLVSNENCATDKGYIIHTYTNRERNKLIKMGQLQGDETFRPEIDEDDLCEELDTSDSEKEMEIRYIGESKTKKPKQQIIVEQDEEIDFDAI